jgi:hypothetical protein
MPAIVVDVCYCRCRYYPRCPCSLCAAYIARSMPLARQMRWRPLFCSAPIEVLLMLSLIKARLSLEGYSEVSRRSRSRSRGYQARCPWSCTTQ